MGRRRASGVARVPPGMGAAISRAGSLSRCRIHAGTYRGLEALDEREAARALDAVGGVEGCADAPGKERIARRERLDLFERVHCERARPREPELVLRALESLQQAVPVARGAVAEAGALFVRLERPGVPDEAGAPEKQVLVEVGRRRGEDAGRAVAPLQPHLRV